MRRFFCGVSFAGEVLAGNALVSGFSAGAESLAFSVLSTRLAGTFIPAFEVAFGAVADSLEGKAAVSGAFVVALAVALVVRLTAFAVVFFTPVLPYALAFAAGAMIYVVVEETIPESQQSRNTDVSTIGFLIGFVVMMVMDVALG